MKKYIFTTLALVISSFFLASNVFAQTEPPCGNIIAPVSWDNFFNPDNNIETYPISNCANPFNSKPIADYIYQFLIESSVVSEGAIVQVEGGVTDQYVFDTKNKSVSAILFLHDNDNYRYVDTSELEMVEVDYRQMANEFFPAGTNIEPFIDAYLSVDPYNYFEEDSELEALLFDFDQYIYINWVYKRPALESGTYTAVFRELLILPTQKTLLQKFVGIFLSSAEAFTGEDVYTVTFTITEEVPELTGASSVLFLPGIMGSRLYEIGQQCSDFGDEQERWFSVTDCKQLRLLTGSSGDSLNDVYTKAGASSVIDETFGFNLYKTFFASLEDLKGEGIINNYKLVPYDWRMRLDYLLKAEKDNSGKIKYNPSAEVSDSYLYKELEQLAASSKTGKVTIVAHSNGGLVAKTLLATLQNLNDPLLAKIDNLILVGSPQLGTPSTLLGMLHGDEVGPYGSVVSQLTTRRLLNTMPMAFHLLPNDSYFNGSGVTVDTPVIQFEVGTLTTPWANAFGSSITSASDLKNFLTIDSGRIKPAIPDLVNPEVIPKYLFDNYTISIDQLMNTWVPPASMKVYQIAGVGLPTQSGLTYFTDKECVARDILKLFKCTAYQDKLGVRPNDTIDGDETVVTPSALGISSSNSSMQRWWLNLKKYNDDVVINRVHKDILEVEDVINFIKNTLTTSTSSSYEYLTSSPPNLGNENRLVFDLHSPLDLSIVTNNGVISSSSVTIEGATYKRFGEMQHISMLNTSDNKTIVLTGEATGSFTLEIGEQEGNEIVKRHSYLSIPSSTSTKVTMELDSTKSIEQAILAVDYDGNGTPEIIYNTTGEVVPEFTYSTLRTAVNNLNIKSLYKKLLLENIKIAEQYQIKSVWQVKYKKLELLSLNVLKQQVVLYERLKVLTPAQKQELILIIDKLIIK